MIKLIDLLENLLENKILVPRRTPEERQKNYLIATQKRIEQYIKNGGQGDLDFNKSPIKSLPDNLKVGGDLILYFCKDFQLLPNGLEVNGTLRLKDTPIKSLPNDLKVGESLFLLGTYITSLPDSFKINGTLSLEYSSTLKSLPDNLKVGGDLILSECINLQSLPNGLEVGKSLILSGTPIKSLPNDLKVNNFLNLRDTPLSQKYTEGEIQSMIPNFKGKLLI
jgi:hypothetical protein